MKVSVVICTYSLDVYDDFCEAVESVLAQTYESIEVVLVVDGTDEVAERVREDYGGREDTTIHVNDENVGLLKSRNTGAEVAVGEIVAFIDDDAVADKHWIEELVSTYERHGVEAAGGQMTPIWVSGQPTFLPEEFYWLIGVTHRGFPEEGEVRNTFGSNISFKRDVFRNLGGFDVDIGGRKGDKNLQGGETELCARLRTEYGGSLYYNPDATVGHKIFEYRTRLGWLLKRAFWQGHSKRAMETFVPESGDEESSFLRDLLLKFIPGRLRNAILGPSLTEATKFIMLLVFTACVGCGYLHGMVKWR